MNRTGHCSLVAISILAPLLMGAQALHGGAISISYVGSTLWSGINDVHVVGGYAYCAATHGLMVLDVSNPVAPALVSKLYLQGRGFAVTVSGNYAYLADGSAGLQVINVSNPGSPMLSGSYKTPGEALSVAIAGSYAYVADGDSGLTVVNVANPASPVLGARYVTGGRAVNVTVSGNRAYVTHRGFLQTLQVLDVSNPTAPLPRGTYSTNSGSEIYGVAVAGNYAYVVGSGQMEIVDITDPASPTLAGSYATTCCLMDVSVVGNTAYLVGSGLTLSIVNVTNPAAPAFVGGLVVPDDGSGYQLAMAGNYAYVVRQAWSPWNVGPSALWIFSTANPAVPGLTGSYIPPQGVTDVSVAGNYAYVACGRGGLQVVDVSNPSVPQPVGSYLTPGSAFRVRTSGTRAYVLDQDSGLLILDIANPTSPVLSGRYFEPAADLAVEGDHVFLLGGGGVYIVNVSNPAAPWLEGTYDVGWNGRAIAATGSIACATFYGPFEVVQVIDVSDPAHPAKGGGFPCNWYRPCDIQCAPTDADIEGNYAYVTDQIFLHILDLSDPIHPSLAGCLLNGANRVTVVGDKAYVEGAGPGEALQIVDVSSPTAPVAVGDYDTPGIGENLIVEGNYIYVADSWALLILRTGCPITMTGDVNTSGSITSADVIGLVNYVFKGGAAPLPCIAAGDVNCSGTVTSADIIGMVGYVFKSGTPPCDGCTSPLAPGC